MSQERKFLHDIATPITIIKLTLRKVIDEMGKGNADLAQHMDRLAKVEKAVDRLEELHASHKLEISKE